MRGLLIAPQSADVTSTATGADEVLSGRWRLHPRVSLRPEPFGALAYHYDNRRLNFLRSHDLVELVKALESFATAREAFDSQGLDERRWPSFAKALSALAQSDFIQPHPEERDRPTNGTPTNGKAP